MTIEAMLVERGAKYGDYVEGTQIAIRLFAAATDAPGFKRMDPGQQYAMFMFCAKMARLLNGDPNHRDSWEDIAGYATCVLNTLTGDEK